MQILLQKRGFLQMGISPFPTFPSLVPFLFVWPSIHVSSLVKFSHYLGHYRRWLTTVIYIQNPPSCARSVCAPRNKLMNDIHDHSCSLAYHRIKPKLTGIKSIQMRALRGTPFGLNLRPQHLHVRTLAVRARAQHVEQTPQLAALAPVAVR